MSDKAVRHAPFSLIGKQGTAIWQGMGIVCQMSDARTNHKRARERAELFVLAANNHYKLVDALEAIEAMTNDSNVYETARQALAEVKS